MSKRSHFSAIAIVSLLVLAFPLGMAVVKIVNDPEVPFLLSETDAQWIRFERPVFLGNWRRNDGTAFRKRFYLERTVPEALLTVRALRAAVVFLDGRTVLPLGKMEDWKTPRSVGIRNLVPGRHELRIIVLNKNGPAALLAYSHIIGISTGKDWEASKDEKNWGPVSTVAEKAPASLSLRFPSPFKAFQELAPYYLLLFAFSFFGALYCGSAVKRYPRIRESLPGPPAIRWLLLGAWALLAVNNIQKVPLYVGFDIDAHREYIAYLLEKGSIPLATEGWQMFQSPFYYIISAGMKLALSGFLSGDDADVLLRVLPLACGALQVELAYRATRYVFPDRGGLQVMGTVIGGLMPMNLYISQGLGNEPLAGFLSAAAIVITIGILSQDTAPLPARKLILLGVVSGLAILTKVTAVLIIPALLPALIYSMSERGEGRKGIVRGILAFLGTVVIVSGWYYLRNWIELGKPFVGGWDASRGIVWWQDPGYRILHDFMSFGSSLLHPVYAAVNGFWDSIYSTFWLDGFLSSIIGYQIRPPWNYDLMLSGTLLALLPTAGIIIGFVKVACRPKTAQPDQLLSVYCVAIYFAALVYIFVTVPIYSTAKATYTVGLIPCYAVLCVTGLDLLARNRYIGAAIKALLVCWALNAYFSYFVL